MDVTEKKYAGSIQQTAPVWKNEKNEVVQKPKNYKDNTTLDMNDFYTLMAAQMKYQDVLNPESSTAEMMTQMVQMSMVNAIQDMMTMSTTTYAASMIGKTVTLAETVNGKLNTIVGVVDAVNLFDGDPKLVVNGKEYAMNQIMQLGGTVKTETPEKEPETVEPDPETPPTTDGDEGDEPTIGGTTGDEGNEPITGGEDDGPEADEVTDTTNKDNPNQVGEQDGTDSTENNDEIKTDTVENDGSEQA